MASVRLTVTSVSVAIFVLVKQIHLSHGDNNNYLNKFDGSFESLSAECRRFAISGNMDAKAEFSNDHLCNHVKSDSFKTSILEGCSKNEYGTIVAGICNGSYIDETGYIGSSSTLNEDKDFMKRWVILVKSFFLECQRFILDKNMANMASIGGLTHKAACGRVKSDRFKKSTLEVCSQDEFRGIVDTVCSTGSTDESGRLKSSMKVNEDEDFLKRWNDLSTLFSLKCKKSTDNSMELIGNKTHEEACNLVKSKSLDGCSQDEYGAIVAFMCSSGLIGRGESSTTLNDDKDFTRSWVAMVASLSPECKKFTYRASTDLVGELTHEAACRQVKLESFESSALEACSQDEYDAGVALVCGSALRLRAKTRRHGSSPTLYDDRSFVKSWVAFVRTLSYDCREFSIIISTGQVADLPHEAACGYFKSDSFKSSALEACSHEEYVAAVDLVCSSGSSQSVQAESSPTLKDDPDLIKSWVALMESLPLECKRFILYSNTKAFTDLTRDAACWRLTSREFKKHAVEICSQDEYGSVVKLLCHSNSGSSHFYMTYTVVFLSVFCMHLLFKW